VRAPKPGGTEISSVDGRIVQVTRIDRERREVMDEGRQFQLTSPYVQNSETAWSKR